ncbi:MAG TPA: YjbQ family protein [Gaiellaceae bacterium]|nr:YjbQ family protein [Gaiellaceae bacterium]
MTSVEIPSSVAAALPTLAVFDITNEVARDVRKGDYGAGLAYVTPVAQTSLIRVTERESGFFCDFEEMLSRLVPLPAGNRERLLLGLLGARTEQIPFTDGRLTLGQWQRILLFGFNGDARADYELTLLG